MNYKVCVVIPIYKNRFDDGENWAVKKCIDKTPSIAHFFLAQRAVNFSWYAHTYPHVKIITAIEWKLSTIEWYNNMLLQKSFYQRFLEWEYMFLFQPDGYMLGSEEELLRFCDAGYDYWGAPWYTPWKGHKVYRWSFKGVEHIPYMRSRIQPRMCLVGNGGVSLRNNSACVRLLRERWFEAKIWYDNEDKFFSYHGLDTEPLIKIPSAEEAERFALELQMKEKMEAGHIPFAVHAWKKHYPELGLKLGGQL